MRWNPPAPLLRRVIDVPKLKRGKAHSYKGAIAACRILRGCEDIFTIRRNTLRYCALGLIDKTHIDGIWAGSGKRIALPIGPGSKIETPRMGTRIWTLIDFKHVHIVGHEFKIGSGIPVETCRKVLFITSPELIAIQIQLAITKSKFPCPNSSLTHNAIGLRIFKRTTAKAIKFITTRFAGYGPCTLHIPSVKVGI